MHFLSTEDLLPVLQHLSNLHNNFPASFWRRAARLAHGIFACGFLSVVTFLICGNPDHLVLLVTAFCPFSTMDKGTGFPMSAFIHVTSKAGIKENHWSNAIPPTSNAKRINIRREDTLCRPQPGSACGGLDPA